MNSQKGFTLVELLVVFSIMAIIAIPGMISFVSYNASQKQKTSVQELRTVLQYAQASALSQVKPWYCDDNNLEGYRFSLCKKGGICGDVNKDYEIHLMCQAKVYVAKAGNLPSGITIENQTRSTFMFYTLSHTADAGSFDVVVSGQPNTTITVTQTGVIK